MLRNSKFIRQALVLMSAMLATTAPSQAAGLISEVFVTGVTSETKSSESTNPGFTGQLKNNLSAGGVAVNSSIDLTSGSLRGSINSVGSTHGGMFNLGLFEQFAFAIPGADAATVTRLGLRVYFAADLAINGASRVSLSNRIYGYAPSTGISVSGSDVILTSADFRPFYAYGSGFNFPDLPVTRGAYGEGGLFEIAGVFEHILYFDVIGANPDITLATNVQAITASNSLLNFGNSAHLGFVLPQGATFTSQSGAALTRSAFPGAVPEPKSWAMLIIGFGLSGTMLRRRRSVAVKQDEALAAE